MNEKEDVLIFGDSHARYFEINEKLKSHAPWVNKIDSTVYKFPASTIVGFGKRNSTLNVAKSIDGILQTHPESIRVFAFGQVDLELGYFYRRIIKEEKVSYSDFINYLIEEYSKFLKKYDNGKIILKGLNLTVLKNEDFALKYVSRIITESTEDKEKVAFYTNKLKCDFPAFRVRNKAHIDFNSELKSLAMKNRWGYFDINEEISNYTQGKGISDNNIPSGNDHHLIDSIFMRMLHLSKLKGCL